MKLNSNQRKDAKVQRRDRMRSRMGADRFSERCHDASVIFATSSRRTVKRAEARAPFVFLRLCTFAPLR